MQPPASGLTATKRTVKMLRTEGNAAAVTRPAESRSMRTQRSPSASATSTPVICGSGAKGLSTRSWGRNHVMPPMPPNQKMPSRLRQ